MVFYLYCVCMINVCLHPFFRSSYWSTKLALIAPLKLQGRSCKIEGVILPHILSTRLPIGQLNKP